MNIFKSSSFDGFIISYLVLSEMISFVILHQEGKEVVKRRLRYSMPDKVGCLLNGGVRHEP
jgi:hypothetical protein